MSSVGQVVGGGIGAIAGFMIGGPVGLKYGAQIGMMIGGLIDPPKGPDTKGPRLDDLSIQTATYGAVIPRIYGTAAMLGNIFWLENNQLKEVAKKKKSGGKGGTKSTVTTYSYFATFALGLCEGPIVAIRRIWIGEKLLYDAGSSDQGAMRASNQASTVFKLYTGTDTQTADPRMQATLGATNVPGYRGLAYLVFYDLPLADYGNSLLTAQIKVEVVSNGTVAAYNIAPRLMPVPSSGFRVWNDVAWNGRLLVATRNPNDTSLDVVATSPDGVAWTYVNVPSTASTQGWRDIEASSNCFLAAEPWPLTYVWYSKDGKNWSQSSIPSGTSYWNIFWNGSVWMAFPCESHGQAFLSSTGQGWTACPTTFSPYGSFTHNAALHGNSEVFIALRYRDAYIYNIASGEWKIVALPGAQDFYRCCYSADLGIWLAISTSNSAISYDNGDTWTLHAGVVGGLTGGGTGWLVWTGTVFYSGAGYSPDGIAWTSNPYPNNAALSTYGGCWNGAVITVVGSDSYLINDCFTVTPYSLVQSSPTLANVVQAELLKSKILTVGDLDVTQLASITVRGYTVAAISAIRAGIEPLQAAWPFDVIQSGYKIKFVKRGNSSIATVSAGELDARLAGNSPGFSIVNVREMDIVMPRKVRVLHSDYDREYDAGEQYAERLNTDAVNIRTLELAIVLTAEEAAGMAEVLLYLAWLERYDIALSLPPTYAQLEASDVITVNATEGTYSLRLTTVTYTQDGRVECQAKYNSAAIYTPTALGVAGAVTGQTLSETGQTAYAVLDIPTIIDTTDTPGVVVAMAGYMAGWNGGTLFKSDDSGQLWSDLQGFAAPGTTMGTCGLLSSGRTDIIDTSNKFIVAMIEGTLASVSELSLFNGANWFAIGDHGRWEIVAVKTCTLRGDGTYLVTDFLRGRYGTEWAMSLHKNGDWFVQLDGDTAAFVNYPLSSIGISHYYRGITNGQSFESETDRIQAYTGVCLECLSPVYLNGGRNPSTNDWTLTWVRRTRIGGEWRDLVDASLSEASESYKIEIYSSGTYSTLKRTLTATSQTVNYTSAEQVTDFGSNQSTLYLKIYQVSANVGPGYPLTSSITR